MTLLELFDLAYKRYNRYIEYSMDCHDPLKRLRLNRKVFMCNCIHDVAEVNNIDWQLTEDLRERVREAICHQHTLSTYLRITVDSQDDNLNDPMVLNKHRARFWTEFRRTL